MMTKFYYNKILTKTEIFFTLSISLIDTGFSSNIAYLLLKKQFYYIAVYNQNTKSFNVRLKMSKFDIKKTNNSGLLTGFYRAV
jgi:hypothetical protein